MNGFIIVNLLDLIDKYGEEHVKNKILSDFSCPANKDVEKFLLVKSIEFAKQWLSQTHLVFCSFQGKLVIAGYFTLANKYSDRVIALNDGVITYDTSPYEVENYSLKKIKNKRKTMNKFTSLSLSFNNLLLHHD